MFEPGRLLARERFVAKLRQGLAAEERKRFTELLRPGSATVAGRRSGDRLDASDVQLILLRQLQEIARGPGFDPLGPERLPQRRDVTVNRLVRSLRRPVAPERFDQVVGGDDVALTEQKESEEHTVLLARRRQIDPIGFHLEPAEQPELHLVPIVAPSCGPA
jgi:hypothetical protein